MNGPTLLVCDHMTPTAVCISMDAAVDAAASLMQEHGIRHLPVMDGSELIGVVSERDLASVQSLVAQEWAQVSVAEAMTPHAYAVAPDTPLHIVAAHMAKDKLGCAVVRASERDVVGIFTTTDALRVLADLSHPGEGAP
jgi:acetoin utilization protein AcuB